MKALHVFDFDDTLIKSDSEVVITKKDGTVLSLNSTDYKHYKKEPGDEFDYSDFNEYPKNAEFIDTVFAELKAAIALDGMGSVVVLTARANPQPVRDFLSDNKISVEVVGTGAEHALCIPKRARLTPTTTVKPVRITEQARPQPLHVVRLDDIVTP